jgi:hypothetical protein
MRAPSELYEALCRQRRTYVTFGTASYTDLTPPLQRDESDALHDWLECGAGPRDIGMLAALQMHWMAIYRVERAAKALRWRRVRGGRAGHAFVGDADVPLCGLVPTRTDGTVSPWRDHSYGYGRLARSLHGECARVAKEKGYRL